MSMAGSNQTQDCYGLQDLCCSYLMWVICGVTVVLLLVSLSCNIVCYAQSYRRGNPSKFLPNFRRSFKSEEVEDNPVYGNINYLYTGMERGSIPRSLENERERKRQICYAKLELPASRDHKGRKLTKTQYTDILNILTSNHKKQTVMEGTLGPRKDSSQSNILSPTSNCELLDLGPSDLYASVRLGRREDKVWGEEYVNKESLKIQ
ncbi:signaling threshold-regulating transmembrane adapter 1-like [Pristis pectinata]|uniref:signaling threshold-regulating transmembrane adapter 1-like n=1 Tax=Pristis pectinata TaxID=685728 RepID=UPI00223DC07A|nr:signaling threshold-regulating transmembrane adapter 1-like [Pristis pectinata]